jgi:hypothetical protein
MDKRLLASRGCWRGAHCWGAAVARPLWLLARLAPAALIYGCYGSAGVNESHMFVLQDVGTTCPRGFTAISYNQTGPTGSPGTLSVLDDLNGIPCENGADITHVNDGSDGTASLSCVTASSSPSASPSPPSTSTTQSPLPSPTTNPTASLSASP